MSKFARALPFGGLALVMALPALASEPVAIVEQIQSTSTRLAPMAYLGAGDTIDLGASGMLKLGYLNSCVSETINGGKVVIGPKQSEVEKGKVDRTTVPCDGGALALSAQQSAESGAIVMRGAPSADEGQTPVVIHAVSPLVRLSTGSVVRAERIDQKEPVIEIKATQAAADFALSQKALTPGGRYKISNDAGHAVIIAVDPSAKSGVQPVLSRLVML